MSQPNHLITEGPWRPWHRLVIGQFVAFAIVGIYSTWVQRYLYGDGSVFWLSLLQRRQVLDYFPARHFAHWLTQIPMVVLLRDLGCRDVRILGAVFGASLYLLPLGGLLLTWWAARSAPARWMVYPLVASSCLFLNMSGFIVSESYLAAALFWPMLYLMLFSERLTLPRSVILISLAIVAMRTYEIYLFLAWPLVFVALQRSVASFRQRKYWELLTCLIACGLFLMAFGICLGSMRDPGRPSNADGFREQAIMHLFFPPVWFSLLILARLSWSAVLPMHRFARSILDVTMAACGLLVLLLPCLGIAAPWFQCCSRVQSLYVPLLLGSIVILKKTFANIDSRDQQQLPELWRLALASCFVATIFQFSSTALWSSYNAKLTARLTGRHGLISFEKVTGVSSEVEAQSRQISGMFNRDLNQFNWNWVMPSLSVALSALNLGEVTTIISAPEGTEYQPFDPNDPTTIPDLSAFGVRNHFK